MHWGDHIPYAPRTLHCVLRGCLATSMHCCVPLVGAWEHIHTYMRPPGKYSCPRNVRPSQTFEKQGGRKVRWMQERQHGRHGAQVKHAAPPQHEIQSCPPHHSSPWLRASTRMPCMQQQQKQHQPMRNIRLHPSTKWCTGEYTSARELPPDGSLGPPNSPSGQLGRLAHLK
jgi:hypothetical protein